MGTVPLPGRGPSRGLAALRAPAPRARCPGRGGCVTGTPKCSNPPWPGGLGPGPGAPRRELLQALVFPCPWKGFSRRREGSKGKDGSSPRHRACLCFSTVLVPFLGVTGSPSSWKGTLQLPFPCLPNSAFSLNECLAEGQEEEKEQGQFSYPGFANSIICGTDLCYTKRVCSGQSSAQF